MGTSFNIKTNDKDIELKVLTGAVELYTGNNQNSVVVLPNQKVMYDGLPQQFKGIIAEAEKATLIKGTEYDMTFRNTSMGTILQRIEGKFNMQVRVDNSKLEDCLITADFTDQSLEDTLRMIGHILSFEYEINGNKITIKGGGCG
jgi:ferric-dicitrate binding protein FerR (iron transport regulator)